MMGLFPKAVELDRDIIQLVAMQRELSPLLPDKSQVFDRISYLGTLLTAEILNNGPLLSREERQHIADVLHETASFLEL